MTAFSRSVAGRRVLVTAGASGIGLSIARAFAAEGADVCVCDVAVPALAALADEPAAVAGFECDVADGHAVRALFGSLADRWDGGIDVLVNNAGIAGPVAAIEDIAWDDWDRTMRVNVGGMFLCIQAAIPLFRKAGGGAIVNLSSTSARTGVIDRLPYVTSKLAVHGLTLNVARELGPQKISCNAVLPGMNSSARGLHFLQLYAEQKGIGYEQALAENLAFVSMREMIDPAEIAAMCVHLGSPAGRNISGQFIGVCGNAEWE